MINVHDTNGQILASFYTRKEAIDFISTKGRYDWEIKGFESKKRTKK